MTPNLRVVHAEEVEPDIPSPFIPGTNIQFAWDSTSLDWLKRCPRLYQLNNEGWVPEEESIHLRFGIEYHQSLHDYDIAKAAGIKHEDAIYDVIRELILRTDDFNPDHKQKNRYNLIRTVLGYLDKFNPDPAVTVIRSDGTPAVEVSFQFNLDFGIEITQTNPKTGEDEPAYHPYVLCGHLDRIVEFNGDMYVMDRKTTSSTPGPFYFNQFEPNNQMSLYTIASQITMDSPVKGVIIDAASVKVNESDYVRGFTYRSQEQLDEWLKDLRYWFAKAEDYAAEGYWPMNDTACDKYGGCKFRGICSKSPQVRDSWLKAKFKKGEQWNPLKTR